MSQMSNEEHLAEVLSRYDQVPNPRLAEITKSLITHLHQFVAEVGLTREEWFMGIEALTKTGHMCVGDRQEFILLSDTIGVSMLVEMINHAGVPGTTEATVFGPFHVDGVAHKQMGDSIVLAPMDDDEPLTITGSVRNLAGEAIDGAELDVWQTASNGFYDVQDDSQPAHNMRGIYTTGSDGLYEINTVRPIKYTIPGDGPAGEWLFASDRHNWRPAHTHFVVSAPGYKTVTTHLFDKDSEYLDSDAVFGVRDSLVVDMNDGRCSYDFVLEQTG